ncbi:acetate kinase [Buchnera aphidicola]|uniref:acetate kinase n=1 Tax=Buchnera aphidicola TaxID=9 RepID=UPI0031B84489
MLHQGVLVLNCGSSSIKFSVINVENNKRYFFGFIERLYLPNSCIVWHDQNKKKNIVFRDYITHNKALKNIMEILSIYENNIIKKITCIGHRVVHGGMKLNKSIIINQSVLEEIQKNIIFSPLHNPMNFLGIQFSLQYFPNLINKNVAVFDTAFYHTLPEHAFLYAIPYYFYKKYNIRRYGAHGISHSYVTHQTSKILKINLNCLNIITCHLGSGSSITAICNGQAVDTSMGLTPLEGLAMGTRSGDLDPSIIFFMYNILKMNMKEIEIILNKKSGFLGLMDNITSDFRYIEKKYLLEQSSYRTVNLFCHRLSKYISAYTTLLDGKLDALVFTGGIGENSSLVRELTVKRLKLLNLKLDDQLNNMKFSGSWRFIHFKNSIPIIVIPTNEELVIANETINLLKENIV